MASTAFAFLDEGRRPKEWGQSGLMSTSNRFETMARTFVDGSSTRRLEQSRSQASARRVESGRTHIEQFNPRRTSWMELRKR
jgi:hypothetical protein